jgi:hypothetical protein
MILFLTSEVLLLLFLAPIQPANPYSPIQGIFPEREARITSGMERTLSVD